MRVLHARVHRRRQILSGPKSSRPRRRNCPRPRREPLPLRNLPRYPRRGRSDDRARTARQCGYDDDRVSRYPFLERRCVMPADDKYTYPPGDERTYIGRRMGRVDGTAKSTGQAKYTYDYNPKGVLYGAFVRSPYAHARITNIDTSEAEKVPGVKAVEIVQKPGSEIHWAGDEVVAIAAVDEPTVRDAVRAVKVEYQQLPHLVIDSQEPPHTIPPDSSPLGLDDLEDMARNQVPSAQMVKEINERGITFKPEEAPLERIPADIANAVKSAKQKPAEKKPPTWYKPAAAETQGDADAAFKAPGMAISEGVYGLPVIVHCCLETDGAVSKWTHSDHLLPHGSTQSGTGNPGRIAG